jgi:hypothetical protein
MVEKHMDDLFRHWLLGFGSGDMTFRTAGTNAEQFEVVNVLWIGRKLERIQQMLQERAVVGGCLDLPLRRLRPERPSMVQDRRRPA